MKKTHTKITAAMKREIEALKNMKESDIDTSDIPVLPPEKWATAQVGDSINR